VIHLIRLHASIFMAGILVHGLDLVVEQKHIMKAKLQSFQVQVKRLSFCTLIVIIAQENHGDGGQKQMSYQSLPF
jgi:hypothetical protein